MKKTQGKRRIRYGLIIPLVIVFIGILCLIKIIWLKPFTIEQLYERTLIKYAMLDPQVMSMVAPLDSIGLDYYNKQLSDPSFEQLNKTYDLAESEQKVLRSFDRSKQTKEELLSTDILDWYLSDIQASKPYVLNGFQVNPFLGVQKGLPRFMCSSNAIRSEGDARDYITRLNEFKNYFDKLLVVLKEKEAKGYIPPRFIVEDSLRDISLFINVQPRSNVLFQDFSAKLKINKFKKSKEDQLLTQAEMAIKGNVYPGYQELKDYLLALLPKTKDEVGVWHQPNGEAYYAQRVKTATTLDITPDEAYAMLTEEVNRLNNQLLEVINNPVEDTNSQKLKAFGNLNNLQAAIDEMDGYMGRIVTKKPEGKALVRFTVTNDTGLAQYVQANIGSSEPATIFVPKSFTSANPNNVLLILYHEGVPGHHLQLGLAREMKNVPTFRKMIPFEAFTEGWAAYAESLPWDMGIINDPSVKGALVRQRLFTMGRAVIDIGINYKHWTREEALKYARENNVCDQASADYIVEYTTANPASELSYAIGCLKIEELKAEAKEALGDKFDIREFHDRVLENGSIPLDILDKEIKEYIAEKK